MSKELSNACDFLLSSTSILSHKYGVMKYNSKFEGQELKSLETKYYNSYSEFIKRLDHLTYLHTLSELKYLDEDEIDKRYNEIADKFPLVEKKNLGKFLEVQRDTIKTNGLLTNYLQIILPTLRSIHHSDLTITESNILNDLEKLYSSNDGEIYMIMNAFKLKQEFTLILQDLKIKLHNLLASDIKYSLIELDKVNKTLDERRKGLFEFQKATIDNFYENELYSDIKDRLYLLIKHWDELLVICDLLPSLVVGLNTDWFQDEQLYNIITDCERVCERIRKYRAVINEDFVKKSAFKDLVMINFNELD